ncbi:MAG: hypothetical protein E7335_09860 [Clostridiales bacterium]|nr:hypothetical protein [Clostridiales bacterium]
MASKIIHKKRILVLLVFGALAVLYGSCSMLLSIAEREKLDFKVPDMVIFYTANGDRNVYSQELPCLVVEGTEADAFLSKATWCNSHNWCCNPSNAYCTAVYDGRTRHEDLRYHTGKEQMYNRDFSRAFEEYLRILETGENIRFRFILSLPDDADIPAIKEILSAYGALSWLNTSWNNLYAAFNHIPSDEEWNQIFQQTGTEFFYLYER